MNVIRFQRRIDQANVDQSINRCFCHPQLPSRRIQLDHLVIEFAIGGYAQFLELD